MFQSLATLLLPADPDRRGVALLADETWRVDLDGVDGDAVVWGRPPRSPGRPVRGAITAALARARGVQALRLRPPHPWRVTRVHRWPPPYPVHAPARNRLRAAALGGALVELTTGEPTWRVCDAAAAAVGSHAAVGRFTPGSGGSILTRQRMPGGGEAMLRVGMAGRPADPARAAAALERLAAAGVAAVPRVLGHGTTAGASWTLESRLPGRRATALSDELLAATARFCGQLPVTGGAPTAYRHDLDAITRAFPEHARQITELTRWLDEATSSLPAIMRHGDLWLGNLLVNGRGLAGIIDWDAWDAASIPGTDLLHVLGTDLALRTGQDVGQIWLSRLWRSTWFQHTSAGYWSALGIRPEAITLEAAGHGWWAAYVAHSIACDPALVADERWATLNVHDVLAGAAQAPVSVSLATCG